MLHAKFVNTMSCMHHYRLELAALHFNENTNREQAVTKKGEDCYEIVFSKYKKGGGASPMDVADGSQPLCSGYDRPEKTYAVTRHKSRFSMQ